MMPSTPPPAPSPQPGTPAADRALLRRFEPVVRYTRGERFFPMDVDRYVRASSLWRQPANGAAECLVPEGQLTLERLAEPVSGDFDTVHFLKFIEPLNVAELAAYTLQTGLARLKDPQRTFHAGRGPAG